MQIRRRARTSSCKGVHPRVRKSTDTGHSHSSNTEIQFRNFKYRSVDCNKMESKEVKFEPVWLEEGNEVPETEAPSTSDPESDPLCEISQLSPEYLECHVKPEILSDDGVEEEEEGDGTNDRGVVKCTVFAGGHDLETQEDSYAPQPKKSKRHQWPFGSLEATFFQHVEQSIRSFLLGEDVPKECDVCCKCYPTDFVVGYQTRPKCICSDIDDLPGLLKGRISVKRLVCHKCGLKMECLRESVKCTQCNERFRLISNLIKHLRLQCKGEPYKCEACGKGFSRSYSLEQHMRSHSAYKCEDCDCSFSAKREYTRHLKEHFMGKSFPCPQCDRCYGYEYLLLMHMKTHTVYSCEECDESFLTKGQYTRHLVRHSLCKPFKCELCHKLFKTSKGLNLHMTTHAMGRPYGCMRCDECFRTLFSLRKHLMKVHTMEQG